MAHTALRTVSTSRLVAAGINAVVSVIGIVVSIAPLPQGADQVAKHGGNPPFAVLVAGVVLGVLGLVGSFGLWRGDRWGAILTIVVRGLDGVSSLPGVLSADTSSLRALAIVSVVAAVTVIVLILRRDERSLDVSAT